MSNVTTKDILFLFKSGKKDKQAGAVTFTGAAGNTGYVGGEGRFFHIQFKQVLGSPGPK